ncbi:hypothetical protein [Prescottella subtropica]|uniref:hypothetical protein n=1 Tax=Prescottella subtropica TaxID=2545757 RepID=UPI0010F52AC7|nr:hypothetical protein [Prescottella subtropica]
MVGPSDVAKFFSASDVSNLVSVDEARAVHRLLGVEIDGRYRYPVFQFDRERKRIKPVAEYANVVMECDLDPWGTLDWWCTAQPHLGDRRPVDVLNAGELSAYDVDRMIGHDRAGMD